MSLEENIASLTRSVDALNETMQHLASLMRQQPLAPAVVAQKAAVAAADAPVPTPGATPKRPPGRPPKAPGEAVQPPPAAANTPVATPASAPPAASGSGLNGSEPSYNDVKELCLAVGKAKGNFAVKQVFAQIGTPDGPSLATTHKHLLGAAYTAFQEVLSQ